MNFHDIHVRIGIVQEDAADVEKLLSCKCVDFLEHGHNARSQGIMNYIWIIMIRQCSVATRVENAGMWGQRLLPA